MLFLFRERNSARPPEPFLRSLGLLFYSFILELLEPWAGVMPLWLPRELAQSSDSIRRGVVPNREVLKPLDCLGFEKWFMELFELIWLKAYLSPPCGMTA